MESKTPFVLFDDAKTANAGRLYVEPVQIITCNQPSDVFATLAKIDQALADGFHVAGYLAYELGYQLEPKLNALTKKQPDQTLIWMGVFKAPKILSSLGVEALMEKWRQDKFSISTPEPSVDRDQYLKNVQRVKDHICAGDVYQINYTFPQHFSYSGSPQSMYAHLRQRQRASYGAFMATNDQTILSLSPELFVETKSQKAYVRPMKGTASRAPSLGEDIKRRQWLSTDEKSKAENLMIVDLLRNDLGRISEIGTVQVTDLYTVETYPTLHQMTSGIKSKLKNGTSFSTLIQAMFPCGSVTGAPKVKAMELIADIETEPRGPYTGAIGYASTKDGLRFNVAIRTLALDNHQKGTMGIGSGIVYDSDGPQEWAECHLKADFVTQKPESAFALLETIKWDRQNGFGLMQQHLKRLHSSAEYFCFPYDQSNVLAVLNKAVLGLSSPQRLRLTLDQNGNIDIETKPLTALCQNGEITFCVSEIMIDKTSPWVYHKTTNRTFYNKARANQNTDEVVLMNDLGEITEGTFTNVFIEKDGQLFTPPVRCGLLRGTLRQHLMETKQATEAVITKADLNRADKIYLGNSVRGLMKAKLNQPL